MLKQGKRIRELALKLNSNNNKIISEAIKSLRNVKPFYGAIGLLASKYDKTEDPLVRRLIKSFMNDLKDPAVTKEVIAEMKNMYKDDTISMLVSSCWQSGLDYSDYSMDLALVFFNGSYVTALECLTVMEESIPYMNRLMKDQIIKLIENNTDTEITDKTSLKRELISLLK